MPPQNRHKNITDSFITISGTRLETILATDGYSTVQTGRTAERKTETRAERATFIQVLSDLDMQILQLERVASQPHLFDIADRPLRRISGVALYDWIGKRVNMGREQVKARLSDIETILKANEDAESY